MIEEDKSLHVVGCYDILENKITLKIPDAFKHELFHMVRSNRKRSSK